MERQTHPRKLWKMEGMQEEVYEMMINEPISRYQFGK